MCRSLVAGRRSGIPERTRGVGKIANAAGPSNLKVGTFCDRKFQEFFCKFSFRLSKSLKKSRMLKKKRVYLSVPCRIVSCGVQRSPSFNRDTVTVTKGRAVALPTAASQEKNTAAQTVLMHVRETLSA